MGSHFGVVGAPSLEPSLVGIGMFTEGRDFDPWPFQYFHLLNRLKAEPFNGRPDPSIRQPGGVWDPVATGHFCRFGKPSIC